MIILTVFNPDYISLFIRLLPSFIQIDLQSILSLDIGLQMCLLFRMLCGLW
jgi:hypothetical protein